MQVINEELRIYRISTEELTMRQIREYFRAWSDNDRIGDLMVVYDSEQDRILIGPSATDSQINLCVNSLSRPHKSLDRLLNLSMELSEESNRDVAKMLIRVIAKRLSRINNAVEAEGNPNSRFVSIEGDIFQISKIVSVKKRDEGNRCFIEFYITNKRASIRKEFISPFTRDSEYQRIRKILEAVA